MIRRIPCTRRMLRGLVPRLAALLVALALTLLAGVGRACAEGELRVPLGHSARISALAFSDDGDLLVSASEDGTVRLFDAAKGLELRSLAWRGGKASTLALSTQARRAVALGEGGLAIFDIDTGREVARHELLYDTGAMALLPDGKRALVLERGLALRMIDLASGAVLSLRKLAGHEAISLALHPDGAHALTGGAGGDVRAHPLEGAGVSRELCPGGDGAVLQIAVMPGPGGARLRLLRAVKGKRAVERIDTVDLATGREPDGVPRFDLDETERPTRLSPDGIRFAQTLGRSARIVELSSGVEVARTPLHAAENTSEGADIAFEASALCWSPRGGLVATGSRQGDIVVAKASDGALRARIERRAPLRLSLALSPDGRTALAGGDDVAAVVLDLTTGRLVRVLRGHEGGRFFGRAMVGSVAVSPDGTLFATSGSDGTTRLWDARTGAEVRRLAPERKTYVVTFAPDGKQVVLRDSERLVLAASVATGKVLRYHGYTPELCDTLVVLADGTVAAASPYNEPRVTVFDPAAPNVKGERRFLDRAPFERDGIGAARVLALHPDRKHVLSGAGAALHLFDVKSGAATGLRLSVDVDARTAAYSADGARLAVGGARGAAVILEAATGKVLARLDGHEGAVEAIAFTPDGKRVVTASRDGTVRVFDAASGAQVVAIVASADGEHVAFTPDGLVAGSEGGPGRFLAAVQGTRVIPADRLVERAFDPAAIRARLSGGDASVGARPRLKDLLLAGTDAPLVRIITPRSGTSVASEVCRVEVEAEDRGVGVSEVRLYLNGKLVSDETRGFKEELSRSKGAKAAAVVRRGFDVRLAPGANELRAVALGEVRIESEPAVAVVTLAAPRPEAVLYLVAVGIDAYKNPRYRLTCARGDATAFAGTLTAASASLVKSCDTQLLLDEGATRASIEAAVAKAAAKARPQDLFVFYFAGHGVMAEEPAPEGGAAGPAELFLVPHDVTKLYGDPAGLRERAIPASLLRSWAKAVPAQKSLFVLDACQSGAALEQFAMRGAAEEKALFQLARSAGTVVLAAAGSEQSAAETRALGHGVFTYALLEGLAGKADGGALPDGKVTVKELEAYLEERVPELTREHRGQAQYPQGFAIGQDFPLGLVR